jgi:hypothetical protein
MPNAIVMLGRLGRHIEEKNMEIVALHCRLSTGALPNFVQKHSPEQQIVRAEHLQDVFSLIQWRPHLVRECLRLELAACMLRSRKAEQVTGLVRRKIYMWLGIE